MGGAPQISQEHWERLRKVFTERDIEFMDQCYSIQPDDFDEFLAIAGWTTVEAVQAWRSGRVPISPLEWQGLLIRAEQIFEGAVAIYRSADIEALRREGERPPDLPRP